MVLNDVLIREYCEAGMVSPFEPKMVNPASLDLRWSGWSREPRPEWYSKEFVQNQIIRLNRTWEDVKNGLWGEPTKTDYIVLRPGCFVLVDTMEYVKMPLKLCGNLMLKSSLGRMGLEHLHAGFFDPGFMGTATLELVNVAPWPVLLKAGQPIVQLVFMECYPPVIGYDKTGRYNGQSNPQPAK